MARLKWAPRAVQDFDDVCEYIARNSEQFARVVAKEIRKVVKSIRKQPQLGSAVPEFEQSDFRERLVYSYRIIYRIRNKEIEIVRIIHGARQLPSNLPSE